MDRTTRELTEAFTPEGETSLAKVEEALPGAGALVGQIMLHNARHLEATFEALYEAEKLDHERTREELREAEARITLMQRRVKWLLGGDLDWDES